MGIYTRRGDCGETGLADGSRVSKASARVEAYGTLDEAEAAIGHARLALPDTTLDGPLHFAQQRLFNCAASLADPSAANVAVSADDVAYLEAAIDRLAELSGGWTGFTLASASEPATRLHLARTVVRRAERRIVALAETGADVDEVLLAFVNRLSDLLFATAIAAAVLGGTAPEPWDRDAAPPALP